MRSNMSSLLCNSMGFLSFCGLAIMSKSFCLDHEWKLFPPCLIIWLYVLLLFSFLSHCANYIFLRNEPSGPAVMSRTITNGLEDHQKMGGKYATGSMLYALQQMKISITRTTRYLITEKRLLALGVNQFQFFYKSTEKMSKGRRSSFHRMLYVNCNPFFSLFSL